MAIMPALTDRSVGETVSELLWSFPAIRTVGARCDCTARSLKNPRRAASAAAEYSDSSRRVESAARGGFGHANVRTIDCGGDVSRVVARARVGPDERHR